MNLKAAILGVGNMGILHAKSLMKLRIDIVAICDISEGARKAFVNQLNMGDIGEYSSFDKMMDDVSFDILLICLPPFAQNGQFEKAARAGKHIFIEKPIALTTNVGREMVKAAKETGVITQVGFHMRWGAAVKKLIKLVESGATGRPVLFNGQYECNSLHTPWWINVELCGGQIFEQAIHLYDMCRYLVGHPKFTSGIMGNVCHNNNRDYTVEDVSVSLAGFTNGAVSSISATNCAIPGLWEGKFTAIYEKLTVFFENPNKARFVFVDGENVRYEEVNEDNDMKFSEIKDFIKAVINGEKGKCSIEEGYQSLCYVEAAVNSAKLDGLKTTVKSI